MWFKRIGLFLLTNILVVVTISIVTSVFGIGPYLDANGINLGSLLAFCFLWGMGGAFVSLLLSKFMAKMMMGVKIIDPRSASGAERELYSRVERLARAANLPIPDVGIYHSPEVNAFATGPSKSSSLVAVSSGLLQVMDNAEVEGVLAHELAHVANGDMVTMTLVQGVINAFVMFFSRIISYALSTMVKDEMQYTVRLVSNIVLSILFSILGSIVVAYFSRTREYRADAGGAKLAGRQNMIAALEKLRRTFDAPQDERGGEALATMKISGHNKWMALFSTHPPLEARIAALKNSGY
ncbi:protease HtpX [Leptospira alstonii]|uniref:Protease HtpX homolog n=2 Tax=Leptospira alstonii TaxID=28452 RepID=M6DDP4_9LEPT|nr:protease HtpX [Leptospira alstonii]EMJ96670.1 putative heat shock protein HtpX [Leptospira alstonii serovar Sichuan str. 79601]EQA78655.1 putative heat shock protein HtpX [Leptospira alstonii serovar Pingchang str. 80-412]